MEWFNHAIYNSCVVQTSPLCGVFNEFYYPMCNLWKATFYQYLDDKHAIWTGTCDHDNHKCYVFSSLLQPYFAIMLSLYVLCKKDQAVLHICEYVLIK